MEENPATSSFKAKLKNFNTKFIPKTRIALVISVIGNVLMIIFGILSVHNCPVNQNIPLFLIVTGVVGLLSKLLTLVRIKWINNSTTLTNIERGLYFIETVFFILGAYWVFTAYKPSYDPKDKSYCNKTAYMFAFIYLALYLAVMITILLGFLCFVLSAYVLSRHSGEIDIESNRR